MVKTASLLAFASCALVAASALSGCSVGTLPGGPATPPETTAAPSQAAAKTVPSVSGLVAVPKDCPSAAQLTPIMGFTVQDPTAKSRTDVLDCVYAGSYQGTTTQNVLEITFDNEPPTITGASLKATMDKAAGSDGTVAAVSGYGRIAYTFTDPGGDGGILVLNGRLEFSVASGNGLEPVERIARELLAE